MGKNKGAVHLYQSSTDPAGVAEGDLWYDSTSHVLKHRDNSSTRWITNTGILNGVVFARNGSNTMDLDSMYRMAICPFALTIVSAWWNFESGSITASNTNYWTIYLLKHTAGGSGVNIVSGTTRVSGGTNPWGTTSANTPHTWDGWTWTGADCDQGDAIGMMASNTGSPSVAAPRGNVSLTVAYVQR